MENYFNNAFQQLKFLNEEAFPVDDIGVEDKLETFVSNDIEAPNEEVIIDPNANCEEDLQDSYIGKVIVECDCCHTRLYKDIKDIIIDPETNKANVEEVCPVCDGKFGYNVIGKIEAFSTEQEPEELEVDTELVEPEGEFSGEEIGEAFKEVLGDGFTDKEGDIEVPDDVDNDKVEEGLGDVIKDRVVDGADAWFPDLESAKAYAAKHGGKVVKDDKDSKAPYVVIGGAAKHFVKGVEEDLTEGSMNLGKKLQQIRKDSGIEFTNAESMIDYLDDSGLLDELEHEYQTDVTSAVDSLFESLEEDVHIDMNNKQVDTDSSDVKVDLNAGTVEVGASEDIYANEDEMIAPLTDEEQAEIEANVPEDEMPADGIDTEEPIDDLGAEADANVEDDIGASEGAPIEEPVEEPIEGEEVPEEDEEEEIPNESLESSKSASDDSKKLDEDISEEDIVSEDAESDKSEEDKELAKALLAAENQRAYEEFDESCFDGLCESFLKRVYDNVNSYETCKVKIKDNNYIIEGLIGFKSGVMRPTTFKLKANEEPHCVKLTGINETFSNSTNAFTVKCIVEGIELKPVAFNYDYKIKSLNESYRICGRIK